MAPVNELSAKGGGGLDRRLPDECPTAYRPTAVAMGIHRLLMRPHPTAPALRGLATYDTHFCPSLTYYKPRLELQAYDQTT